MNFRKNTNKIKILTPTGFQEFLGVTKKEARVLQVKFANGKFVRATVEHLFVNSNECFVRCDTLKPNDVLHGGHRVVSVSLDDVVSVYDPVGVKNGAVYISGGVVSHNCEFLGSSLTLFSGYKIGSLAAMSGKNLFDGFVEFEPPRKDGSYVITTDVARGAELDYSAFVVIDISTLPYKVVARYKNNKIDPQLYPEIIFRVARAYNEAFVLIETNDIGQQVADILFYDLEYENVYMSFREKINEGQGRKIPGLRTTKKTKALGCSQLKTLVENDSLILNDFDIISEASTFVRVNNTYKAEEGKTDDLMMCLVMFGYLTLQPVFKDLFDFSLRHEYLKRQLDEMNEYMEPIGFVDRGPVVNIVQTPTKGYIEGNLQEWNPFL